MLFKNKIWLYLIVITCTFFVDQITKKLAIINIGFGHESDFIPGFMRFYVVQNTGGAFSLLKNYPIIFLIVGIANIILFVYLIFLNKNYLLPVSKIGASFVLGGTLGNLTDRLIQGAVTDFLDFQFIDFAVFNLADASIDVGVVLLIAGLIIQERSVKDKISDMKK